MTVDPRTFRLVVVFVGVALLACIGGIIGLSAVKIAVPDVLIALGGTIVGYFGGLFTNPHSSDTPTPVTIADEPVQVTNTPKKTVRRRPSGDGGISVLEVILIILVVAVLAAVLGLTVNAGFWALLLLVLVAIALVDR